MQLSPLLLALLPLAAASHGQHNRRAAHVRAGIQHADHGLDERAVPTTTTTVVIEMTQTQTVWVAPTSTDTSAQSTSSASPSPSSAASQSSASAPRSSSSLSTSASTSSSRSTSPSTSSAAHSFYSSVVATSQSGSSAAKTTLSASQSVSSSLESGSASASRSTSVSTSSAGTASNSSASHSTSSAAASAKLSASSHSTSLSTSKSATSAFSSVSISGSPSMSYSGSPSAARSSSSSSAARSSTSSSAARSSSSSSAARSSSSSSAARSSSSSSATRSGSSSSSAHVTSTVISSSTSSVHATSTSSASKSTTTFSSSKTATSTSSAASASTTLKSLGDTIMNAYYPDWSGWYLEPESVDFDKFDVIDFAFALPTSDFGLEFTQDDSSELLTRLVTHAHSYGKRVKLSIGGWTGSTYFSTICGSAANRKKFITNVLAAYTLYDLDGIDIDWEYPGLQGAGSNAVASDDSANFLLFLQELRAALPSAALISTATQDWPFADANGNPMTDVSAFADVIDWILLMNYDVWGSSSTPGANAPLADACGNSSQPLANAYAAVASWTAAGMPANQITLGVPAYGYLQMSTATGLKDRRRSSLPHKRANEQERSSLTVTNSDGGTGDGQIEFYSLISQGALVVDSAGEYVGGNGFVREWDTCSSTPWLRSASSGQIVTYDDPESMSLKGQFAAQAGLRGCNVFSIDGDWTGSGFPLTDAVRSGLGL